ncbi:type VI secretion system baseplate subunit TssF [Thorsellia anophelis]|uniref:Type VI secretion system protein ImpG n=1 Tax=Thorsellia anophelis DSM 18579 TaxID=1123402 RepID=A0A1I0FVX0_9GAMM|nr:type VI secretion system baseplate subunit TssF [Thorsellia anophelis]SET61618.1 type VI secretion system protein ImpG [Thorsellia anophelis DSM 18579]
MDNQTLRYYEAEMRYLREAGKEFAEAFPDRAALLNLDRVGDRDPYVERLFEGFAFLMGRLREKLDDDLPELTEGLVSLLWPHYLRTVPSMAIVQLSPDKLTLKQSERLSEGFEIETDAVGLKRTHCIYRTTRPIVLRPFEIASFTVGQALDGRSMLTLRFSTASDVDWDAVDLDSIPLYLHADAPISSALYVALVHNIQQAYYRLPELTSESRTISLKFTPMGFASDDPLWPKGDASFSGYQLLLEYFTFRDKFMFVGLTGLNQLPLSKGTREFEIDLVLSEQWPVDFPLNADNLKLHASPVINLFTIESDPMSLSSFEHEHLLRPLRLQDGHTEIYSVDRVASSKRAEGSEYVPFTSFRHRGGMLRQDAPERYFHTRMRRGVSGLHDTWLILGGDGHEQDRFDKEETLSLNITCTNGQLPRKALRGARFTRMPHQPPIPITLNHLTAPTLPCYPPANDRFHWRLLSHLGTNFLSMMDNPEVLRGTLALYDWTEDELNQRRLESIVDVKHKLIQRFERGFLMRGVSITVTIDQKGFTGEGDILLFGELLNLFFALYADVHLFNQLTIQIIPTGKQHTWNENHSQHIPG